MPENQGNFEQILVKFEELFSLKLQTNSARFQVFAENVQKTAENSKRRAFLL